jgi:hypothetical protein
MPVDQEPGGTLGCLAARPSHAPGDPPASGDAFVEDEPGRCVFHGLPHDRREGIGLDGHRKHDPSHAGGSR